jgi:hypothetical protein
VKQEAPVTIIRTYLHLAIGRGIGVGATGSASRPRAQPPASAARGLRVNGPQSFIGNSSGRDTWHGHSIQTLRARNSGAGGSMQGFRKGRSPAWPGFTIQALPIWKARPGSTPGAVVFASLQGRWAGGLWQTITRARDMGSYPRPTKWPFSADFPRGWSGPSHAARRRSASGAAPAPAMALPARPCPNPDGGAASFMAARAPAREPRKAAPRWPRPSTSGGERAQNRHRRLRRLGKEGQIVRVSGQGQGGDR